MSLFTAEMSCRALKGFGRKPSRASMSEGPPPSPLMSRIGSRAWTGS